MNPTSFSGSPDSYSVEWLGAAGSEMLGLLTIRMFVPHAFTREPWEDLQVTDVEAEMVEWIRTRLRDRPERLSLVLTVMARDAIAALSLANDATLRETCRWLDQRIKELEETTGAASPERAAVRLVRFVGWEMDEGKTASQVADGVAEILGETDNPLNALASLGQFCAEAYRDAMQDQDLVLRALDDQAAAYLPAALR